MASTTLAPYKDSTTAVTFKLVNSGSNGATYQVEGRDIATPYQIQVIKKFTNPSASANDHVQIRVSRTERNATTQKLATVQALLDVSIPKDTSILTLTAQKELLAIMCSLLRDATANAATNANIAAIVSGFDL